LKLNEDRTVGIFENLVTMQASDSQELMFHFLLRVVHGMDPSKIKFMKPEQPLMRKIRIPIFYFMLTS
jgi:hypothetical protein